MRRMPHQRDEAKRNRAVCGSFKQIIQWRMPHQRDETKRNRAVCDSFK